MNTSCFVDMIQITSVFHTINVMPGLLLKVAVSYANMHMAWWGQAEFMNSLITYNMNS